MAGLFREAAFRELAEESAAFSLALAGRLAAMARDLRAPSPGAPCEVEPIAPASTPPALASHVGAHREAIAEEFAALAARGLVAKCRRRLEIPSLAALEASVGPG